MIKLIFLTNITINSPDEESYEDEFEGYSPVELELWLEFDYYLEVDNIMIDGEWYREYYGNY